MRRQLATYLTIVFLVSFTLLGYWEYLSVKKSLLAQVDEHLRTRVQFLQSQWKTHKLGAGWETRIPDNHPLNEMGKVFFEIADSHGNIQLSSDNLGLDHFPPASSGEGFFEGPSPNGQRLRILQIHLEGERILRVAESLQLVDSSLHRAVQNVAVTGLLLLTLSLAASWNLLTIAIRPLEDIARTSCRIMETGNMSLRLEKNSGPQEVASVSKTLNSLLARVEEVLKAQAQLLSDTSHELRNPLAALQVNLEMLRRDTDSDTRQEVAAESLQELNRLGRLVDSLLLLSWVESRPPLALERVDLKALAEQELHKARKTAGDRHLELSGQAGMVLADCERVQQILLNLIQNAVRHTAAAGTVRIRLLQEGNWVHLQVEDDGEGIPEAHRDRVFERFYRVDTARARRTGGAGLGLAVARALSRAQGGELTLRADSSRGCSFELRLRAADST